MESTVEKVESKESSATGDPSKDSMEGSSQGERWCLEALQGATWQDPCLRGAVEALIFWEQHLFPSSLSSENLEVLVEKVGTLGLQDRLSWTFRVIQANLQHSTAASRVLSRTLSVKGIDVALIQEPWYCKGCIRDLNIPGYTLFFTSGTDRPRACILTRNETAWMLPGFSCRDLVAVLIKYNEEGAE
jgi:hypothetical protein